MMYYEVLDGAKRDYTEAIKWYQKAAEQGYARAQYTVGDMYEKGEGVSKDVAEAIKWYRKAAKQGHEIAKDNLRRLNETW